MTLSLVIVFIKHTHEFYKWTDSMQSKIKYMVGQSAWRKQQVNLFGFILVLSVLRAFNNYHYSKIINKLRQKRRL